MNAVGFVILIGLYFAPTVVGAIRKVPNIGSVLVINLFLGWSIIGWIVAMAMAARSVPQPQQTVVFYGHQPERPPTEGPLGR